MHREDSDLESRLRALRTVAEPVAFDDGFADRVMARLATNSARPVARVADTLPFIFARIVPFAAAAAVIMAVVNLAGTRTSNQPLVDRVLGLPAVTLAAAYTIDTDLTTVSFRTQ